ncbi:hypothetical protein F0Q45_18560 [Mycobacterium simiae]|uniref:Uncharacterized protein n=1 Tax=Mycobacterium simiae TaxID=1784 RepID=A0A5B1BK94_MYCSI|nr:hypothetical protein F0Q45_18560 [Mycobacterium simiae]
MESDAVAESLRLFDGVGFGLCCRPDHVSLIFNHRIMGGRKRNTPGRFRTPGDHRRITICSAPVSPRPPTPTRHQKPSRTTPLTSTKPPSTNSPQQVRLAA